MKQNNVTETYVQVQGLKYGRIGYIKLVDDAIVFDTSEEEYGPMSVSLSHLRSMLDKHKNRHLQGIDNQQDT